MTNNKKSLSLNTILLGILILISLANGCQSCTTKNLSIQNNKNLKKLGENQELMLSRESTLIDNVNNLEKKILKSIETNATMGLILEKEIDDRSIKSSEIKQLVNDYRK